MPLSNIDKIVALQLARIAVIYSAKGQSIEGQVHHGVESRHSLLLSSAFDFDRELQPKGLQKRA